MGKLIYNSWEEIAVCIRPVFQKKQVKGYFFWILGSWNRIAEAIIGFLAWAATGSFNIIDMD